MTHTDQQLFGLLRRALFGCTAALPAGMDCHALCEESSSNDVLPVLREKGDS